MKFCVAVALHYDLARSPFVAVQDQQKIFVLPGHVVLLSFIRLIIHRRYAVNAFEFVFRAVVRDVAARKRKHRHDNYRQYKDNRNRSFTFIILLY